MPDIFISFFVSIAANLVTSLPLQKSERKKVINELARCLEDTWEKTGPSYLERPAWLKEGVIQEELLNCIKNPGKSYDINKIEHAFFEHDMGAHFYDIKTFIDIFIEEFKAIAESMPKLREAMVLGYQKSIDSRVTGIEHHMKKTADTLSELITGHEAGPVALRQSTSSLNANDIPGCKIKKGSQVNAKDLLRARAHEKYGFRSDVYIERDEVDKALAINAKAKMGTILVGKPLAGKSRAFLNLANNIFAELFFIIIETTFEFSTSIKDLRALVGAHKKDLVIFVFNDIHDFVEIQGFENFFTSIIDVDCNVIIGTCHKSDEESVKNMMGIISSFLEWIEIPPIDDALKRELAQYINRSCEHKTDDTIGSYFFPKSLMEDRYRTEFPYHTKDKERIICREILRSYRCLNIWRRKNRGNSAIIHQYVKKRLECFYGMTSGLSDWELRVALVNLGRLGFITIDDEFKFTYVETVYVNGIIAKEESDEILSEEIAKYYPTTKTYNKLLFRVNENHYNKLFDTMTSGGIVQDDVTFTTMITRSRSFDEAKRYYIQMKEIDIRPSVFTFSSLLTMCNSCTRALPFLDDMIQYQISPTIFTFSSLIKGVSIYSDARQVIQWALQSGVELNSIVLGICLSKSENFYQALVCLDDFRRYDIPVTNVTFYNLVAKAKNFTQAKIALDLMTASNIKADEDFLNSVLRKKGGSLEDSLAIYEELFFLGYNLQSFSYKQILERCTNFQQAKSLFFRLSHEGACIIPTVANTLLKKANTYNEAREAWRLLTNEGVQPTQNSYNTLMGKCQNFEDAWELWQDMNSLQITPDAVTLFCLLKLTPNLTNALAILDDFSHYEIKLTYGCLNALLKKANLFDDAWRIFNRFKDDLDLMPSYTVEILLKKTCCFSDSVKVLDVVAELNIKASRTMFHLVLNYAQTAEDIIYIFGLMESFDVRPTQTTINLLRYFRKNKAVLDYISNNRMLFKTVSVKKRFLFVRGIGVKTKKWIIEEFFSHYGKVLNLTLIPKKGIAFVEMLSLYDAQQAVNGINFTELDGDILTVTENKGR